MKIVVVGCGKVGKTIISALSGEHEVLAIDNNDKVVAQIVDTFDVMGLCANGTEHDQLERAGVSNADLFIAVTGSDELNMLSCFAAKKMGAKHTVARIRNSENNTNDSIDFLKQELDLDMIINPEMLTAKAVYNLLRLPSATKVETFSSRKIEMIELPLDEDSKLDGVTVADLKHQNDEAFLISTVLRDGEVYIPNGSFALQKGDKIGIITTGDIQKLLKSFGESHKKVKDVIIMGGGEMSLYLSRLLSKNHIATKIIEKDKDRCRQLCEVVGSEITVINGDAMSQELLKEERMDGADAFVGLTGEDEQNILMSYYATTHSVSKVVCKVNRSELGFLAEKLGLDSIISPRKIVADVIVRYARAISNAKGSQMETLYFLMDGKAEAAEFKVLPKFKYIDVPLKDIKFKKDVLVAGIIRGKNAVIPTGNDVIQEGDKVVVVAGGQHVYSLDEIIA